LYEPSNNTLTNNYSTTINFTATDDLDLTFNCTLYFNSILNQTKNVSNGSVSEFKINITDGTHTWNILCNDSHSLSTNSSTRTINIDTTEPNFISESYTSSLELGDNQTLTFVANDTYLKYVNLSYDGTNYTLENSSTTFSKTFMTLINGTNNFTTYTADYANNINDTSRNFTVRDTITGPRLMNLRYTSSVTYNSNQYITLYLIDSRTISSALLSYNGTNHTLSNNTYYNFTYTFTASTCGASTFKIFTNDTLNNAITNTTNFTVTGCCGDGICSSETCTTCSTDCGACSNTTSSSGGGGGGGGGSTTPITTTQTLDNETEITIPITTLAPETPSITDASTTTIIDQASPDNPINIKIDSTNLFISLTQNVSDIEINLKSLDTLPESLPPTKNQMFKAIEIDITNLNSSAIAYANITFQVDKNWLNNNSLDKNKVQLERYTTSWTPLATTLDSEDDNYYYFTATTPGFSYFAITTEKINESRTNWILISLGTIFLLVALILFMIHELKRNED
jgi:PGF-pre-PGF domain-containing protein